MWWSSGFMHNPGKGKNQWNGIENGLELKVKVFLCVL